MTSSPDPSRMPTPPLRLAGALRESWRLRQPGWLRADLLAGCVVGIVALPLSMALAIASGARPEAGLHTAVIAGATIALLGGSRYQVSGPTAAFVVLLAPIAASHGLQGLALAGILAGLLLIAFALLRLGQLIQFVPYPVTMGFTAGIAVVIATLQVEGFLGLSVAGVDGSTHFPERVVALVRALPTTRWPDAAIGGMTLAVLALWPRTKSRVPGPLVALAFGGAAAFLLTSWFDDFAVATLASRFGTAEMPSGIPRSLPLPAIPWSGGEGLSLQLVRTLFPSALAIALLAAIESLLSAVVADGATGSQHDPDGELLALGIGNVLSPLFGGIPATGALARTATNVRSGAHSPIAAVVHALFVLASMLLLAPVLGHLPMASLAALLVIVAWNMGEARHVVKALREAPRSDAAVLLACLALTVAFDMTIAVTVGMLLAAVLFMRRMVEITHFRLISEHHPEEHVDLPPGVQVYEIGGPLFFGAAHKATSALRRLAPDLEVLVIDLRQVPTIDATGLFNLRSAVDRLSSRRVRVVFGGVRRSPRAAMERAGLIGRSDGVSAHDTMDEALAEARRWVSATRGESVDVFSM